MKRILFFSLIISFILNSCEEKPKGNNVTLYYYGYSGMGYTYEVPLRFYYGNEVIGFFKLYSTDKDLQEGLYTYNEKVVDMYGVGDSNVAYKDFTFFKNQCKWGDRYVTDGYVSVKKEGEIYTFVVSVQTADGIWHDWQYCGKIKKEKFEAQSEVQGFFADAYLGNRLLYNPLGRPWGLPSDYSGGNTWVQVEAGTIYQSYIVSMLYTHPNANNPTGIYYVNSNANGYYQEGESAYQNECSYTGLSYIKLESGFITITRVDKPYKFKIDVDVTDINGGHIQGSFDGGHIISDYE